MIRLDLWSCFGCCKGGARLVLLWLQSDTSVLERRTLTESLKMKLQFSCVAVFMRFCLGFFKSNMLPGVYAGVMQLFLLTSLIFREAVHCVVIL